MSDESTRWVSVVDVLIPDAGGARVLLRDTGDGLRLPRVEVGFIWANDIGAVCHAVQRDLGLSTRLLYAAAIRSDEERRCQEVTFALENRDAAWSPGAGARWAGRADLGALAVAEQRAVAEVYFDEREQGPPPARPPWGRAGWLDEAAGWIERALADRGEALSGAIEQVKCWSLSCVLRAPASGGDVYLKAAADLPLFVNEPAMLAWLARRYPRHIPAPLALDVERGWVLLRDFGPPLREASPTAEARELMLVSFAAIQRDCVAQVGELLGSGCHDRRLALLPGHAAALLADEEALAGLDPGEREHLRALLPRLTAMCHELAALGIPETLVHGDLHLGNVAVRDGACLFFDWTDSCISHPFFDLISVFDTDDAALMERLRDAYLAVWEPAVPLERLRAAWELARPLSDLHQAVSYQHILAGIEPTARADFGEELPSFLRSMLRTLGPAQ